jgi:transposase
MTSRHYIGSATPDVTKRYASDLNDQEFELIAPHVAQVVVCAASIADSDGAEYIFHETEGRFPRLHTVLVDQGYKGWLVECAKRWFGIIVDIVQRPAAQREFVVQSQRWKIERTFGWLDWSRILSKEYERTTESSASIRCCVD